VILACNTAHLFADELVLRTGMPLSSLVSNTESKVREMGIKKLGIISSPTSMRFGVFNFDDVELVRPTPPQMRKLETVIEGVIAGQHPGSHIETLRHITDDLLERGAEAIVLGCTELELVLKDADDHRFITPLRNTVEQVLRERA